MRLRRSARLYGIFLQQCLGWQLVGRRYWWVSVSLVYKFVHILSSSNLDWVIQSGLGVKENVLVIRYLSCKPYS